MTVNEYLANSNVQLQDDVELKNYGDLEVVSFDVKVDIKLLNGNIRTYTSHYSNNELK